MHGDVDCRRDARRPRKRVSRNCASDCGPPHQPAAHQVLVDEPRRNSTLRASRPRRRAPVDDKLAVSVDTRVSQTRTYARLAGSVVPPFDGRAACYFCTRRWRLWLQCATTAAIRVARLGRCPTPLRATAPATVTPPGRAVGPARPGKDKHTQAPRSRANTARALRPELRA